MKVRRSVRLRGSRAALPSERRAAAVVRAAFRSERRRPRGEINVIFVDERAIRRLNRDFLGERGSTDVIAFPYDGRLSPPRKRGPRRALDSRFRGNDAFGDVYVAVPVAIRNARRFGDTAEREIVRLIVHGTLHLLGHDDHAPAARKRMWKRQEELVDRFAPPARKRA